VCFGGLVADVHALGILPTVKWLVRGRGFIFVIMVIAMITNQADVDSGEQSEDDGLDQTDQQLHEVEDKKEGGAVEEIFTAVDVAEEANGEGERADKDRKNFDAAHDQEDQSEDGVEPAGSFLFLGLVAEEIDEQKFQAGKPEDQNCPSAEGKNRESDGAIKVRSERTDERTAHMELPFGVSVAPTNGADARNESHPIIEQNENEQRDEDGE